MVIICYLGYITERTIGDAMLKKFGDLNPISIINPVDVDTKSTKKALKATIKSIKNEQNEK